MISEGIELMTPDFLMTFTGAVMATNIITHFVKDYIPDCIDKKIVTLIIAAFIVFSNQLIFSTPSLKAFYLSFLNSFLVATAAMGNYEILSNKTQKRREKELKNELEKETVDKEKIIEDTM